MDDRKLFDIPMGENFDIFVLIKSASVREDRKGNEYILFTFQDKSGSIDGLYWSAKPEEVEKFTPGKVVALRGKRELYNGRQQVRISGLRLAYDDEPNDPSLYIEEGPMSKEEMEEEINQYLDEITHPTIHAIVAKIMEDLSPDFYYYPAAKKHHHAFVGGLAYHTISILRLVEHAYEQYPHLNKSLLYGGAMIHDGAKVYEFKDPITGDYSLEGNLEGHISLMGQKIAMVAEELGYRQDDESVILLKHMVLSHHGKQEYGSPVVPHLMEAEVVHYADDFDAHMNMMETAVDSTEPGEFSTRVTGLDGRNFYRPTDDFEGE